jgi:drug/metabolite transporter (DMT)-like permease
MSALFTGPGFAIVLAVLGAICFATAAVLQHRAVSAESGSAVREGSLSMSGLRAVARRPAWLAGLGLAGVGSGVHAVALVLAPLSVVQPIGVLAVPIAVLLTAVHTRRMPGRGVIVGVAICVAGVGGFVGTAAGTAVSTPAPDGATLFAALVVTGIVLVLAAVGLARSGWVRCVACATAGAVAFGLLSALVRAVSQSVKAGDVGLFDPAVLAAVAGVVAAAVVGGWLVQQAFAAGAPAVVVACLTVVDPIVAVLLGLVLLGEGAATPPATWLLLIAAALTAVAGVVALARHHPDATSRSGPTPPVPIPPGPSPAAADRPASSRPQPLHRR